VHPKALLNYDSLDDETRALVERRMAGYADPVTYYVDRLAEGVSTIAAAFAPAPVIVRLSDFKSNEYANLIGGKQFEPQEENPMLGYRGASRFVSEEFKDCFELECRALRKVREKMGLENVWAMIPFVRTPEEGRQVIEVMKEFGLERGKYGLRVIMMCELPSNALLADQFLDIFDGFSTALPVPRIFSPRSASRARWPRAASPCSGSTSPVSVIAKASSPTPTSLPTSTIWLPRPSICAPTGPRRSC
jgi:pyruvate,water dikinase